MSSDIEGICLCDESAFAFPYNDECVTCTGEGDLVENDDGSSQCVCRAHASLSWNDGWVCSCNNGYHAGQSLKIYIHLLKKS